MVNNSNDSDWKNPWCSFNGIRLGSHAKWIQSPFWMLSCHESLLRALTGFIRPSSSLRTIPARASTWQTRFFKEPGLKPVRGQKCQHYWILQTKLKKQTPILENQRKFGLLAFQSQGLSLRSLGSLTLVQLPAKRSDVPCTELGSSESGNESTRCCVFPKLGDPTTILGWSIFEERFLGFLENLTSERADVLGFMPGDQKVYPMRARTKACDFKSHQSILQVASRWRQDVSREHDNKTFKQEQQKTVWIMILPVHETKPTITMQRCKEQLEQFGHSAPQEPFVGHGKPTCRWNGHLTMTQTACVCGKRDVCRLQISTRVSSIRHRGHLWFWHVQKGAISCSVLSRHFGISDNIVVSIKR